MKTPIVMINRTSTPAYTIFNPNNWADESKQIISSCAAQCSLLHYEVALLPGITQKADKLCKARFRELREQWKKAPWDIDKCNYFVEIPEYHLHVQAFLATIKTLLDFLAQLISTEGIVNKKIHGFHKKGNNIGGELMEILLTKANPIHKNLATHVHELISKHKTDWIDQSVKLRDDLVHPEKGISLVMFGLEIKPKGDGLELIRVLQPAVNGQHFENYAQKIVKDANEFSVQFLRIIKTG